MRTRTKRLNGRKKIARKEERERGGKTSGPFRIAGPFSMAYQAEATHRMNDAYSLC